MEWNMKNNPTFKDISANRSSYFLTVRRHSAFVARDYYNSRLNKWFKTYDDIDTPFDNAKYKGEVLLRDIRQKYENGKDATFALYVDGDKYKEMLETIEFPIYVGR